MICCKISSIDGKILGFILGTEDGIKLGFIKRTYLSIFISRNLFQKRDKYGKYCGFANIVHLKSSGELLILFIIVSVDGKMIFFTLGNSYGTKLWFNEKD